MQRLHELLNKETSRRNEERRSSRVHAGVGAERSAHTCLHTRHCSHTSCFCSYGDRVEHFRVLEGGGQYCIWEESFCSLNRLVDFYRTHSIAAEKVICLRDPPSSPRLLSPPGRNPYPNPYRSSSQESLLSARLYSHPERESSPRLLGV